MKNISVAVGVIRNSDGEIFLTQRSASVHMANRWEFPGGKIELHETPLQALSRELMEEIGIEVTQARPLDRFSYDYPEKLVTLHFFLVEHWQGQPWGKEGQPYRWQAQQLLDAEQFPPANHSLVDKLIAGEI